MNADLSLKVDRELNVEEQNELAQAIRSKFKNVDEIKITPVNSMALTGVELFISIAISFATSIAANATYDITKFAISHLSKRNIKASEEEE